MCFPFVRQDQLSQCWHINSATLHRKRKHRYPGQGLKPSISALTENDNHVQNFKNLNFSTANLYTVSWLRKGCKRSQLSRHFRINLHEMNHLKCMANTKVHNFSWAVVEGYALPPFITERGSRIQRATTVRKIEWGRKNDVSFLASLKNT